MTMITAKVQAGRVELAVPSDWPNGLEVEIRPVSWRAKDDDSMSPEETARVVAGMDALVPFENSLEVYENTERLIRERKQREKDDFAGRMEKLKQGWE